MFRFLFLYFYPDKDFLLPVLYSHRMKDKQQVLYCWILCIIAHPCRYAISLFPLIRNRDQFFPLSMLFYTALYCSFLKSLKLFRLIFFLDYTHQEHYLLCIQLKGGLSTVHMSIQDPLVHAILIKYDLAGSSIFLDLLAPCDSCKALFIPNASALFIILYTFCLFVPGASAMFAGFLFMQYLKSILALSTFLLSAVPEFERFSRSFS